ncbi:c-type cytochrome [Rhodoferax sp.]|uniref:c-type cytochrome n=1 Tax=Rhodoferax sp. TaxID=50421 RepID=UPI00285008FA|nr:c-type cytochrome [Rhodoferax sp.]MDR3367671.1 c-type cytochrome [Rhodoferax sp.]
MTRFLTSSNKTTSARRGAASLLVLGAVFTLSALLLVGCTVELENKQAAQEMAQLTQPPGSIYTGWRVFQERCASCHGSDALGTAEAPSLLPLVHEMGPRRFVGLVLKRYDWNLPPDQAHLNGPSLDALIEQIMRRQGPVVTMPAWQDEPRVTAHITDLFAYLSARAEGTQGPGRPAP